MIEYNSTMYVNLSDLEDFNIIENASEYFKKLPDEVKLKVVGDDFYEIFQQYAALENSDDQSCYVKNFIVSESEVGINITEFDTSFYVDFVDCNYLRNRIYLK